MENLQKKFQGALVGLAVGDAVGTTNEFQHGKDCKVITDMVGGGPFHLKPGEWTDDTSMALCLAASLVVNEGNNPNDQLTRYWHWYRNGYMSSNGYCFDIGTTTSRALRRFHTHGEMVADPLGNPANGSIMRLAPVPMFFAGDAKLASAMSALSSKTTHSNPACLYGCAFLGMVIEHFLMHDASKKQLLHNVTTNWVPPHIEVTVPNEQFVARVMNVTHGSFFDLGVDSISQNGSVWETLEAALWAFNVTDNFKDGALLVARLGDDSDTVGAVFGQIAGAFYGIDGIPVEWVNKLAKKELVIGLADALYQRNQREDVTFEVPQY